MDNRTFSGVKRTKIECAFCSGNHYSDKCMRVKSLDQKMARLKQNGSCFRCLAKGHRARACPSNRHCYLCKGPHHQSICNRSSKSKRSPALSTSTPKEDTDKASGEKMALTSEESDVCLSVNAKRLFFLQTATAQAQSKSSYVTLRLLLDSGSQRSYITRRLADALQIKPDQDDHLIVYTFGSSKPCEIASPSVEITLLTRRGAVRTLRVNIVPHIADKVPFPGIDTAVDFLADDGSMGEQIDVLVGNDYYFSLLREQRLQIGTNLYLQDTDFGWIVSGCAEDGSTNDLSLVTYCQHNESCPFFAEPDLPLRNVDMKFLWSLESIGILDSPKTTHEEEAIRHFNETVKFSNGRYEVKWPWITYPPELPTNFGLSFGRLRSLLQRADGATLRDYEDILNEQLHSGIIEPVEHCTLPVKQGSPPIHYLPHHIVKQIGKKGRLVYDASARTGNQRSLNECMYKGPSLLEDLTGLLVRFRLNKIGISADIAKAFLQVGLQPEDRDVTRFLWVKDINKEPSEDNLIHYRFCRVPFGVIASPFLLTATIRHHMSQSDNDLLKRAADRCYVDNLVTGAMSQEEAMCLYQDIRKSFNHMSMNIRDWVSNDLDFLKLIPEDHQAKQQSEVKLLGLIWTPQDDMLQLKSPNLAADISEKPTKKVVLSALSRLYDPCGFASPLVLPAKMLFQELCIRKLKWDSPLPEDLETSWTDALENIKAAKDFKIPRYIGDQTDVQYELHCFTDASNNAYAAVVYIVSRGLNSAATAFLMSKSRITPAEDKTELKIPRLELLGFLIGNRLLKYVAGCVDKPISKKYLWTDSLIVLAWVKTERLLPPFVARRVNEIKQHSDVERRYVPTQLNPADVATRPNAIKQRAKLWFSGPDFLIETENNWPVQQSTVDNTLFSVGRALDDTVDGPEMTDKGYEDHDTPMAENDAIDSSESMSTCQLQIKEVQKKYFPDETAGKITHLSRNLGLFKDDDGILRCGGRLTNTGWSYDRKHPMLLPKDCDLTMELILKAHKDNYHVGVSHTLSIIRKKFWIPQGRAQVQKVLKQCSQCIKHGGGPYLLPPTPALPEERVKFSSPFNFTGMDYLGPLFVETPSGKEKRWICLFTCLAVRAIHLEVVNDLSAEHCLMGLRRFIAIRGRPNMIVSDNATQFKLTSEILADPLCVKDGIRWKFIPQLAPWHGGVYERLIALVKNCLKRTLEKHLLQDGQLLTVIKEVEAVINTRPLTNVGSEIEVVLTPADFLSLGNCLEIMPTEKQYLSGTLTKVDLLKSWKRGQGILSEFKKMFCEQYLPSLREKHRERPKQPRVTSDRSPSVGDIVQIKDDSNKNRNNWRVGKITALIRGKDGQCRVAKVLVGNHEFVRSIGHLYPLEAELEGQEISEVRAPAPEGNSMLREEQCIPVEEVLPAVPLESPMEVVVDRTESEVIEEPPTSVPLDVEIAEAPDAMDKVAITEVDQAEVSPEPQEEERPLHVEDPNLRVRREAAVRARQKIAEWTRHLLAVL